MCMLFHYLFSFLSVIRGCDGEDGGHEVRQKEGIPPFPFT